MRSHKEKCRKCGHEWYVLVGDSKKRGLEFGTQLPPSIGCNFDLTATSTTPCDCFDDWDSDSKTVPDGEMVVRNERREQ